MAPNQSFSLNSVATEPISRTYQYRKVMKPLLERKRRARINHCLDELKELMTNVFQAEGENVAKLEKADILELTVRHLHILRDRNSLFLRKDAKNLDRFWDGFRQCANEVSEYLSKFDTKIGNHLLHHIHAYTTNLQNPTNKLLLPLSASASANKSLIRNDSSTNLSVESQSILMLQKQAKSALPTISVCSFQQISNQRSYENCNSRFPDDSSSYYSRKMEFCHQLANHNEETLQHQNVWRPW